MRHEELVAEPFQTAAVPLLYARRLLNLLLLRREKCPLLRLCEMRQALLVAGAETGQLLGEADLLLLGPRFCESITAGTGNQRC